ncbi:class I SAM-dependent methyltransferase [Acrocarpospora sp. B8E8]
MGLGKLFHNHTEHADEGGTIDRPRLYEIMVSAGFLGGRRPLYLRIAALSGLRPGDAVLDVGCGTGYLTRIIAPVTGPDGHVTGVDPSPQMIEYARRRAPGNSTYIVGKGESLDLPDASTDVVISTLAIHHMPAAARATAIGEMFRVLRPGGRLLIVEFRPPTGRLTSRLVGALTSPAMRHNLRDLLGELIPEAGFRIEREGDLKRLFYYVRAVRPT